MIFLMISTIHIRDQILPLPLSLCKYPGNSGSADVQISGLHPLLLSCGGKALSARAVPADAILCGRDEQGLCSMWWQWQGSNTAALWRAKGKNQTLPHSTAP